MQCAAAVRKTTRLHSLLAGGILLALSCCTPTADGDAAIDATEPLRGSGQTCGGFAGLACDDGLDCFYAVGSCGRSDEEGRCGPRPEVCTFIYHPVCGCDGRTYSNRCEAARSGVSIARHGPCEKGEGEPATTDPPRR
jgi:hypothetical protein